MEARYVRVALAAAALSFLGASHRTPNFIVEAATPGLAREVGETAESLRDELAVLWLGKKLPKWSRPCPVSVKVAPTLGAGGATSFVFNQGEVYDWRMNIQGSRERVLDSVLPHEVTHTIFASHFRRPLPRWADEGACTTVEHESEREKQKQMLVRYLRTNRGISFSQMFAMRDYPPDVLPLYAQGYSLARFLIEQKGRREFLEFLADGMRDDQWDRALAKHYGVDGLGDLQETWLAWVRQGSPPLEPDEDSGVILASAADKRPRRDPNLIFRAQSADLPQEPDQLVEAVPVPADDPADDRIGKPGDRSPAARGPRRESDGWRAAAAPTTPYPTTAEPRSKAAENIESPAAPKQAQRRVILEWSRAMDATHDGSESTSDFDDRHNRAPHYDASRGDLAPIRR